MQYKISYIIKLIGFSYKKFPILMLYPILALFSVCCELLAMSILLPLSEFALNHSEATSTIFSNIFSQLGIEFSIKNLIILFAGIFLVRIFSNAGSQYVNMRYGKKMLSQFSSEIFYKILNSPYNKISEKGIGHYITLAGDEAARASAIIIDFNQLASLSFLAILYYASIIYQSFASGIFLAGFLFLSFIATYRIIKKIKVLGSLQIEQAKSSNSTFIDSLNGLRTVKAFIAENYIFQKYRKQSFQYTYTLFKVDFLNFSIKFIPIIFLLSFLIISVSSDFFLMSSSSGFDYAKLITLIFFLLRFFPTLGQMTSIFMKLISEVRVAQDILDAMPLTFEGPVSGEKIGKVNYIELKNVSYRFPNGKYAFKDVNVKFETGRSYAIYGPSGIGKSTFLNLIGLLIEGYEGQILVNGKDIKKLYPDMMRKKIILFEQDTVLFNDTIKNNLLLGEKFDDNEIINTCKKTKIHEHINSLSMGYNYNIFYQASNLSGGQKQRIGLARTILRNPDAILLDEVTSALDNSTKKDIVENLLAEFKDKIIIFVTHDQFLIDSVDVPLNFESLISRINTERLDCPLEVEL